MNAEDTKKRPLVLHILPQSQKLNPASGWTQNDWQVEFTSGQFIADKIRLVDYKLIVDGGVGDLWLDLLKGTENQSTRFLETKSHSAKFLVDLAEIQFHQHGFTTNEELWDQLGKHLAWRFCALDRPVWVRFIRGILMPHETTLLESLELWSSPSITILFDDSLESASKKVLTV